MAGEIAEAFVRIRPNMAGFEQETLTGVKSTFRKAAEVAGLAYGAKEVFDFGKDAAKDAAAVQKSQEVVRAEFGKSGKAINEFAEGAGISLGAASHETESVAARFGILFHNLGIGKETAATMTTNMLKLGDSIAAIRGIDPTTVLDRLPIAMAGNVRGLKQLGIAIDANAIKSEALALGYGHITDESGKNTIASNTLAIAKANLANAEQKWGQGSTQVATAQNAVIKATEKVNAGVKETLAALSPAQRAQVIYAIATKNLGDYQKQAAAHSNDYANVQRRLSAEWDKARETLGAALLPELVKVSNAIAVWLDKAEKSGKLQRDINSAVQTGGQIFGAFKTLIVPVFDAFRTGIQWLGGAKDALIVLFGVMAVNKIRNIASAITSTLVTNGLKTIGVTAKAEAAEYVSAFGVMDIATLGLADTIKAGLISTGIGAIAIAIGIAAEYVITHWSKVKGWFAQFWGWLQTGFKDAIDVIKGLFYGWVAAAVGELKLLADAAAKALGWLPGIGGKLKDAAKQVDSWYSEFSTKSVDAFADIGKSSADSFANSYISTLTAQQAAMLAAAGGSGTSGGETAASPGRSKGFSTPTAYSPSQIHALLIQSGATPAQAAYLTYASTHHEDPGGSTSIINDSKKTHDYSVGLFQINFRTLQNEWMRGGKAAAAKLAQDPAAQAKYALSILRAQGPGAWPTSASMAASFGLGSTTGGGGGGGGGGSTTVPNLFVGSSAKSTAQQVADAKTAIEKSLKAIIQSEHDLGPEMTKSIKQDTAAVRKEITDISSKADVTKARSNLGDLKTEVTAALKKLRTEISLNNTFDGLKTQVAKLGTEVTPAVKAEMAKIQKEIGTATTPTQIANLKRQMTAVKNQITAQLKEITKAVDLEKSDFDSAWSRLASGADAAFQKATAKAIAAMKVTVTGAFASFDFGADITQTPAEAALAALTGSHQAAADAKTLADAQAAVLTAQQVVTSLQPDAAALDQATRDVNTLTAKIAVAQDKLTAMTATGSTGSSAADVAAAQAQLAAMQNQLAKTKNALDTQALTAQIAAQRSAIAALQAGTVTGSGATSAQIDLAQAQLDQMQSDLATAQQKVQDLTAPDPDKVKSAGDQLKAAQDALDEANYNAKVTALQQQATLERTAAEKQLQDAKDAYQTQRDLLQTQMDDRVSIIEQGMLNGTISASNGLAELTDVFKDPQFGLDLNASGLVIGGQFYSGLSDGLKPVFDLIARLQADMQAVGLLPGSPGGSVNKFNTVGPSGLSAIQALQVSNSPDPAALAAALRESNADVVTELKKQTDLAEAAAAAATDAASRIIPIGTAVAR